MNAPRPANVAYVDAEMVDAAATLDEMVESYRRGSVEFNVDAAARYLLMSRATVDLYDHFEAAKLLAVAVARLGDLPAPPPAVVSGDLFAVDVVPASPQDDAVSALDAHLVEMSAHPAESDAWKDGDAVTVTITGVHVDGIGDHHTWLACEGLAEGIELPFVDDDGKPLPNVRIARASRAGA